MTTEYILFIEYSVIYGYEDNDDGVKINDYLLLKYGKELTNRIDKKELFDIQYDYFDDTYYYGKLYYTTNKKYKIKK